MGRSTRNYYIRDGYDYQRLVVSSTTEAVGFDTSKITEANRAFCTAEGGAMRFRYDGSDPTSATLGHELFDGDPLDIDGVSSIKKFRVIKHSEATEDGIIHATFENGVAKWEPG